jgi:hypothetical protein
MLFKRIVLAALVLALMTPMSVNAAEELAPEALVLVQGKSAEAGGLVEKLGLPVYHRTGNRLLVGAGDEAITRLGGAATVVDRAPWTDGDSYYWVMIRGGRDAAFPVAEGVRLLHRRGGLALVKASAENAEPLSMAGHHLVLVTPAPKTMARPARRTAPAGTRAFGGEIDDMVAAITQLHYTGKIQTLENFGTRYSYASQCDTAADWIYNQFAGFGLDVERHYFSIGGNTRQNIIATIPGLLYPDEVVFISAHYDSTSQDPYNSAPGADDDGSGSAAVIEAARVISGYTFERTIKFACFAGEEQGLVGSGAYVADIAAAGMNVIGCYNFDMIGYSGSDPAPPDFIIYTDPASTAVAYELRDAALYYVSSEIEPVVIHESLSASDHGSFWAHGYQAIVASEDEAWGSDFNPDYHTTNDLVANCDLAYATSCTRAAVAAVADTAVPFTPSGMRVSPAGDFLSEGANGGPFTPQQFDYTLTSYENYPIGYTVSESAAWLDASTAGGTIPALGTVTVTLSINSAANGLADGAYDTVVDFVNTTNHDGDTTRTARLTVGVPVVQQQWTMDSDPGWTAQGLWAFGQPTGGGGQYGNPDPTGGYSGSNVYGYNLSGDYENYLSERHLTSAAIDCSTLNSVILKFRRYLNVEQPTYDHAYVRVSNDGSTWTTVWQNTAEVTDSAWTLAEYDIAAVADGQSAVYLRWTMGSTDSAWQYSGWNIDDVEIWGIDGSSQPQDTVQVAMGCTPDSGVLPFATQMAVSLTNLTTENRRAAGRIDVVIGNGTSYTNWRAGWTNLSSAETYGSVWNQNLPGLASLVGSNVFTLHGEDVTPPPYNQPPYAASGDTDTNSCTVTGIAP